jgi:hypothetical protein
MIVEMQYFAYSHIGYFCKDLQQKVFTTNLKTLRKEFEIHPIYSCQL